MASLQGKEILVIDDAPEIRVLAERILRGDGAIATGVASVDQGLAQAKIKAPHLIITDLGMPGRDGFDFLQTRLNDPVLRDIPTIVLSGESKKELVIRAAALGATDYMLKPFRATSLLQKVRKALKLSSFLKKTFVGSAAYDAELVLPAEIVRLNETGFEIESAIKLPADHPLSVSSETLSLYELDTILKRTGKFASRPTSGARYLTEVFFVGIDQALARRIRTRMGGGK